jgi:hypothetical protein
MQLPKDFFDKPARDVAELNQRLTAHVNSYNNAPLASCSGLSPNQMADVLYRPLSAAAPVRLQSTLPDAVLDQVPFFRQVEELLRLVQREKVIKLTATGALPRKFVQELYEHGLMRSKYVDEGFIKLNREFDSPFIEIAHYLAHVAKLVKKPLGKLSLTKKGESMLVAGQRPELFRLVLEVFTGRLHWGSFDSFGSGKSQVGQLGWSFCVYLLARFGQQPRPLSFYVDKYVLAFPNFLEQQPPTSYWTPATFIDHLFSSRVLYCFGKWFGLVEIKNDSLKVGDEPTTISASPVLSQLFVVSPGGKG